MAETDENGAPKTELELLIERIQKIQEELPTHEVNLSEQVFTEAAEEQFADIRRMSGNGNSRIWQSRRRKQ